MHRKLLNDDDIGHFDVAEVASDLVVDVVGALKRSDIVMTTDLHEVIVPADMASPLALILNELIGDAVRRGLSDGGGEIHLEVRRLNGHFLVRVIDTVIPVVFDQREHEFGTLMLETCARQLGAEIARKTDGKRTEVSVTLMVNK